MKQLFFALAIGILTQLALTDGLNAQDAPDEKPAPKETAPEKLKPQKSQADLEKDFAEALSNCELVGQFTIEGQPQNAGMKPDRYLIGKVAKAKDDYWALVYYHKNIPIPLILRVIWAGDTPVMTLDEFTIAGLGTFSSRIMFDLNTDLYAGTWQHGDVGGLMFGRIDRAEPKPRETSALEGLKTKVAVSFNREPLRDAFEEISKQTKVPIVIDGDALKDSGYTQNMPQTFDLEDTGMAAVRKIIDRYQGMCIVLEEDGKTIRISTKRFAVARKQRVLGVQ